MGIQTSNARVLYILQESYNLIRKDIVYNILIEYDIPMKQASLIKMCPTETYRRVRVGKNLSDMFPSRNGLKQGEALSPLLFNFALDTPLGGFR